MGQLKKYTVKLLKLGIAQTMIQALAGCTGFFVNQSLMLYTTLQYVAVWNVVQKIYTVWLMPIVGITQRIQTILAYYSGHREEHKKKKNNAYYHRVHRLLWNSCPDAGFLFRKKYYIVIDQCRVYLSMGK